MICLLLVPTVSVTLAFPRGYGRCCFYPQPRMLSFVPAIMVEPWAPTTLGAWTWVRGNYMYPQSLAHLLCNQPPRPYICLVKSEITCTALTGST
jgi:hypothetical protein